MRKCRNVSLNDMKSTVSQAAKQHNISDEIMSFYWLYLSKEGKSNMMETHEEFDRVVYNNHDCSY